MSLREHDMDRGQYFTQPTRSHMSGQPSVLPSMHEPTRSPAPMANLGHYPPRDFSNSPYPSGLIGDTSILATFRYHIGIYSDPSLNAGTVEVPAPSGEHNKSLGGIITQFAASKLSSAPTSIQPLNRPAPNVGIYQRVVIAEAKYHREYRIFSLMINGALGLQIIIAAALTALGAGNGPHTAVTAFGALNTVIAGLLTFLKGSGLPNRLKYYENEWSKLREYIEQRERDFVSDVGRNTIGWDELTEEIAVIEGMYDNVRKDIEANTPDSYVSMSNAMKTLSGGSSNNPKTALGRLQTKLAETEKNITRMGNEYEAKFRQGVADTETRANRGWSDLEKQATSNIREVVDQTQYRARDAGKQAELRFNDAQRSMEDGLRRTQSSAETRFHDYQDRANNAGKQVEYRLDTAQRSFNDGLHRTQSSADARMQELSLQAQEARRQAEQRYLTAQTTAQDSLARAQNTAYDLNNRAYEAGRAAEFRLTTAGRSVSENILQTRDAAQSRLSDIQTEARAAGEQVEHSIIATQQSIESDLARTQQAAESRVQDAQSVARTKLEESQHAAEAKAREMEEKIAKVAEMAAEKVLAFTRHRHHEQDK